MEAFARGFVTEANLYGFGRIDYVRFVNHLLDHAIAMKRGGRSGHRAFTKYHKEERMSKKSCRAAEGLPAHAQ